MKNDALNRTKLNSLSKDALILLQQSENFQLLSEQSSVIQKQNEQLIKQIESLKEHHIKVYAGDCDKGGILRAKAPNRLLSHSILIKNEKVNSTHLFPSRFYFCTVDIFSFTSLMVCLNSF